VPQPRILLAALLVACGADKSDDSAASDNTGDTPLADVYTLDESTDFPEGIAYDPEGRAFWISSVGHGGVFSVSADGSLTTIHTPEESDWSTLGVLYDAGQVHVCAVRFASTDDAVSELWSFDAATGARTHTVPLAGTPNNCNDLVVDGDSVYLTDRESSRIHHVDLSTDTAEVWFDDPILEPQVIGNNGIVLTNDNALLVGQYAPPRIVRIPVDSREAAHEVPLSGDDIGTVPNGADGIRWWQGDLLIAANERLVRVSTSDNWSSGTATATDLDFGICAVTEAEGRAYGLKGEIVAYVLGLEAELPFEIRALTVP